MTGDRAVELVAAMSHELRSPLTSIRGFTKLLLDRWDQLDDATKLELIGEINRDADRVGRLMGELLQVARIEAGQLRVSPAPIDLDALVERCGRRVVAAFDRFRCEFERSGHTVIADEDKVEQIVLNLFENAAKYATGGVAQVSLYRIGAVIEIHVADDGPAIDAATLESLFDIFARRDGERVAGTGVGLWISRRLAEAHGGTLHAEPNARGGKTFIVRLAHEPER